MKMMFICTGNTCRSPMAAALARHWLQTRDVEGVSVSSAGLNAVPGAPPSEHAVAVMQEIGLDISAHRARSFSGDDRDDIDLFVVMTPSHVLQLQLYGMPGDRIQVLGLGISDPYGGTEEEYRRCRDQISEAVAALLARGGRS